MLLINDQMMFERVSRTVRSPNPDVDKCLSPFRSGEMLPERMHNRGYGTRYDWSRYKRVGHSRLHLGLQFGSDEFRTSPSLLEHMAQQAALSSRMTHISIS